jgi:hypothetical protein
VTLQWAATLVNTKPTVGAPETLNTVADLLEHMAGWSWTGSMPDNDTDLAQVRRVRDRLRTLWDVDVDQAVDIVNALLRDGRALPQLVIHEPFGWHIHGTDPDAPIAVRMAVDAAMAMVERSQGQRSVSYAMALVQRFEMQAERGALEGALQDADRAIALLPQLPDNPLQFGRPTATSVATDAALLLLRHGQPERARRYAERGAAESDRYLRIPGALALAEVQLRLGDAAAAERAAEALLQVMAEPEPKLLPASTVRARIRMVRGEALLARGAHAQAQQDFLAAGRDVLSNQPRDQARVQLGLGRAALAMGDAADLALALQRAQPLLAELGGADPVRLELELLAAAAPR